MQQGGRVVFVPLLLAALGLLAWTVRPFLLPVLVAAVLVALTQPVRRVCDRLLPGRPAASALVATLAVFLGFILPLSGLAFLVVRELADLLPRVQGFLPDFEAGGRITLWAQAHLPARLAHLWPGTEVALDHAASRFAGAAGLLLGMAASAATSAAMNGFLLFVGTYYLFLDGDRLLSRLIGLLPMSPGQGQELARALRDTAAAVIWGTGVVGLVQAVALFAAFCAVGVDHALVWAALVVVVAFVPLVGSALVWAPMGMALLASGREGAGLFLLCFGLCVSVAADNGLRPILVRQRLRVHPLLIFLTIFGGVVAFGAAGILLGPLIGSLATTLVRFWERDYSPRPRTTDRQLTLLPTAPRRS